MSLWRRALRTARTTLRYALGVVALALPLLIVLAAAALTGIVLHLGAGFSTSTSVVVAVVLGAVMLGITASAAFVLYRVALLVLREARDRPVRGRVEPRVHVPGNLPLPSAPRAGWTVEETETGATGEVWE